MYSYNSSLESVLDFFLNFNPVEYPETPDMSESDAEYMTRRREYV